MSLDTGSILDKLQGILLGTAYFETVVMHEPTSAPGPGKNAAIFMDHIAPTQASGLDKVSVLMVINVRIFANGNQEPKDDIDKDLATVIDLVMNSIAGDFTLDGEARNVDIFGVEGTKFQAQYGYLRQDSTLYRMADITVPIIINDVWTEEAGD